MNNCSVNNLLDLGKTIAKELFDEVTFPWEVLPNIKEFIVRLGPSLSRDRFDNPQENVWIAKTANIFDTAYIAGPCIIDEGAEVRHCAFIRGSVIVGKNAVVGNSTELKNFGAVVGDYTEVGCNTVLCPGTIIGRECIIYPQSRVRGVVNAGSIYKDAEHIIKRQ